MGWFGRRSATPLYASLASRTSGMTIRNAVGALVEVEIRGVQCLVVLYPVDDPSGDVYALGSAYPR